MAFFEIRGGIPLRGSVTVSVLCAAHGHASRPRDRERRKERCTADNMCIDNGR